MEKTISFHKITAFLLSQIPIDTITGTLYEQLCLPAMMWKDWRRFAELQSSGVLLFPEHSLQKECRRDLKIIVVKVAAACEPLLKHLWQCCWLLSCCSGLLLPPDDELESRLLPDRIRS